MSIRGSFGNRKQQRRLKHFSVIRATEGKFAPLPSFVYWWKEQPHNNKYILLIVFCPHFSLSPSFCSAFTFLSPSSCPHYLSLVYSITFPPVLMPSCLLVLIFIYRFSSFSLPFLCTDGTLQLASHSASCLTFSKVNAFYSLLPFFWYKTIFSWSLQDPRGLDTTKSTYCGWRGLNSRTLFKNHKGQPPSLCIGEKESVSNEKRIAVASYQKVYTPVTELNVLHGCWCYSYQGLAPGGLAQ